MFPYLTIGISCANRKGKSEVIELAKQAEAHFRYVEMAMYMQEAIKLCSDLSDEERAMLSKTYKYLAAELAQKIEEGGDIKEAKRIQDFKNRIYMYNMVYILRPAVLRDIEENAKGVMKMASALEKSITAHKEYANTIHSYIESSASKDTEEALTVGWNKYLNDFYQNSVLINEAKAQMNKVILDPR